MCLPFRMAQIKMLYCQCFSTSLCNMPLRKFKQNMSDVNGMWHTNSWSVLMMPVIWMTKHKYLDKDEVYYTLQRRLVHSKGKGRKWNVCSCRITRMQNIIKDIQAILPKWSKIQVFEDIKTQKMFTKKWQIKFENCLLPLFSSET